MFIGICCQYYNITFRDEVRFTRSSIPLNSCRSNRGWVWSSEENNEPAIRFSLVSHGEQYQTDQFGTNLHENDYHAIIQSMLGVMKLPSDEPLIVKYIGNLHYQLIIFATITE